MNSQIKFFVGVAAVTKKNVELMLIDDKGSQRQISWGDIYCVQDVPVLPTTKPTWLNIVKIKNPE